MNIYTFSLALWLIQMSIVNAGYVLSMELFEKGISQKASEYRQDDFYQPNNSGDLPKDSISGFLKYYSDDEYGCTRNSTFSLPSGWGIIMKAGNCTLEQKAKLAQSHNIAVLMVLDLKDENPNLETEFKFSIPIIVLHQQAAIDFNSLYSASKTSDMTLKFMLRRTDSNLEGLYEFTLISIAILLTISFTASLLMHLHLYRLRRVREQALAHMHELQEQERIVVDKEDLEKYPIVVFKATPDSSRKRKESNSSSTRSFNTSESAQDSKFSSYSLDNSCAICIEDYRDGESLRCLPCKHRFHVNCIDTWITEKNASCPLCKMILVDDLNNATADQNHEERSTSTTETNEYGEHDDHCDSPELQMIIVQSDFGSECSDCSTANISHYEDAEED